jgi:hypothetical protein
MIYGFYKFAWVFWLAAAVVLAVAGQFTPALVLAFGLAALAMVHGAAVYLTIRNTGGAGRIERPAH